MTEPTEAGLRFLPITDLLIGTDPPVDWLIPEFVSAGSLIALAGEPGTGKSFTTYTLSLALATGTDCLGFRMNPHRVLYFDQENARPDCVQYLRWAWVGLGRPSLDLVRSNLHFAPFALGGSNWADRAADYVMAINPALIVIDTTTPSCNIEDENDNAEATKVITAIRRLQALCSPIATVIALKHAKVRSEGGGHTLRGAKAWEGAVDSIVFQTKTPGKPRADGLSITKLSPAKTRAFGLRSTVEVEPQWIEEGHGLRLNRR